MSEQLKIHDNISSDVVKGLAHSLGVDYEENNREFCLEIPESLGSGNVKAYEFDSGFGVVEADIFLKESLDIEFKRGVVHPLKMIFNRQSQFEHGFTIEEGFTSLKRLENIITASTAKSNHIFKIPAGESVCFFCIEINRKVFEEKIETFLLDMNEDLIELFRDVNGINQFLYKSNFSLEISKFIEEFTECELDGFMRHVYLEGKAYEIFTHQLKQYLDDLNGPERRKILRQSTIESIEAAAEIIKEEMETLINVSALAKRVGLNQNTLQSGFQQLYGASVNEYLRNHRVDTAKVLLETTALNITEITYKVGINSRSYFTKLFKKRYGQTPKSFIAQHRKGKGKSKSA